MRKQDITNLLSDLDEETAVKLGEQFPPLTDAEHERIFRRIGDALELSERLPDARQEIAQAPRFAWMRHAAAAAACLLILGGSLGGILALDRLTPAENAPEEMTDHIGTVPVREIGERMPAANLAESGALWITVDSAGAAADGLYEVTVTLENTSGRGQVVLADNLMTTNGVSGGIWNTVQPCGIITAESSVYPYALAIPAHTSRTVTLQYRLVKLPEEWMLVTGYGLEMPCIKLN